MHAQSAPLTLGIDHVGLTVSDLDASRRFFCECLGWRTVGENPSYPAVFVSDGRTRVTLWRAADPRDFIAFDRRRNVGLHHLALKVADRPTSPPIGFGQGNRGNEVTLIWSAPLAVDRLGDLD